MDYPCFVEVGVLLFLAFISNSGSYTLKLAFAARGLVFPTIGYGFNNGDFKFIYKTICRMIAYCLN